MEDYLYFKSLRARCKERSEQLYASYIASVNNCISNDPIFFWKFIQDRKNSDSGIPIEMFLDQISAKGGKKIVNLFAEYFSSAYTKDNSNPVDCDFEATLCVHDVGLDIKISDVFDGISGLKQSCNPGPDGVPNIILRKCKFSLCLPLFQLFKKSLLSGTFPKLWKSSYIVPIFKSGESNKIDNYRGVCNQSAIYLNYLMQ